MDEVSEQTMFVPAQLPEGGRDWVWHAELNLVELRAGMTLEQKLAAVEALKRHWTRAHLRVVESA